MAFFVPTTRRNVSVFDNPIIVFGLGCLLAYVGGSLMGFLYYGARIRPLAGATAVVAAILYLQVGFPEAAGNALLTGTACLVMCGALLTPLLERRDTGRASVVASLLFGLMSIIALWDYLGL